MNFLHDANKLAQTALDYMLNNDSWCQTCITKINEAARTGKFSVAISNAPAFDTESKFVDALRRLGYTVFQLNEGGYRIQWSPAIVAPKCETVHDEKKPILG